MLASGMSYRAIHLKTGRNYKTIVRECRKVLGEVSKRLAVAQAATMGVGRSMLGLMGGPVGLIATVGLTALSFVEFGDKAKGGMDKAANATEQAAMRIRNATRNLLPSDIGTLNFDALQEQTAQVEAQLKSARDNLEQYQRSFDAGAISAQWVDGQKEKVAALEGALSKLKGEMDGVRFASDTAGESYSKNLERQAVLVGKVTEEQRLLAMVTAGYIKLSEPDLKIAIERAKRIDAVSASLKGSTGELKEQANAYQALYDRLYPAEAALAVRAAAARMFSGPSTRRAVSIPHTAPRHRCGLRCLVAGLTVVSATQRTRGRA